MPKLKVLSGREVLAILFKFGFEIEAQHGSHAKFAPLASGWDAPDAYGTDP